MARWLRTAARTCLALLAFMQTTASPWLALALRLWLAQAFVVAGVQSMMHGPPMSGVGIGIQSLCPALLAIGLLTRPAAAALLLQAVLTRLPGAAPDAKLFWIALLGWLIMFGAGPLSIDRLLRRGSDRSAVPAATAVSHGFAWITRRLGAPYQLALRLWLAAAPAGLALATLRMMPSMHPGLAPSLPAVPSMVADLSPLVAASLAMLLAMGLAVRPAALVLLLLVPLSRLGPSGDIRLYWALLLALHVVHGGGRWSLDQIIATWVRRASPVPDDKDAPHVVVVGGGFGGVAAVQGLAGTRCRITLVDQRNHTLFQPLLYQVATAGLAPGDIATPIRSLFRDRPGVTVLLGQVSGVDRSNRAVLLPHTKIPYDYLVLATGARHSYFGHDDWATFAPGLKSLEDATTIRRRLLLAFEEAEAAAPADKPAWLTFVIVGGGPTGVELAGAIAELARHGMAAEFRSFDPASATVILVQSADRLLPGFPPSLSADAARTLRELGVDVQLDRRVEAVAEDHVTISGVQVAARTVFWAAGVMASPAASWLGVAPDRAGRIPVGPDLSVAGCEGVFAIGDTASSMAWGGNPVPGLAPAAKQGGAYVARVIRARIAGRRAPGPFRYRHLGSLATIGRQSAVADFGFIRLRGAVAWWLWGAVHIAFLFGGRNRVMVMIQWLWAYLTLRRGTRLITAAPASN